MTKEIIIDVAVIPNRVNSYCALREDSMNETARVSVQGWNERFNLDINEYEPCLEIWFGGEDDSFQNHGTPEEIIHAFVDTNYNEEDGDEWDEFGIRYDLMPYKLPVRFFKGKKEGDVIDFGKPKNGVQLKLRLNQAENRYARYGTFEEVVERVSVRH